MGLLDIIFGKKKKQSAQIPKKKVEKHSEKEIFESPSKLADWVTKYIIKAVTLEDDFDMAPDESIIKSLNITFDQIERLAREQSLLRALGASLFIKKQYDNSFYLKYFQLIYKSVAVHMYSQPSIEEINDTRDVLEVYLNLIASPEDDDFKEFKMYYLRRIYDGSDKFYAFVLADIGLLALDESFSTFELMRDGYCRVVEGMSYESFKLISDTLDKVKSENQD